jgi:hypothetical protein
MVWVFFCFEDLAFRLERIIQSMPMIDDIPPGLSHILVYFLTVTWPRIESLSLFLFFIVYFLTHRWRENTGLHALRPCCI